MLHTLLANKHTNGTIHRDDLHLQNGRIVARPFCLRADIITHDTMHHILFTRDESDESQQRKYSLCLLLQSVASCCSMHAVRAALLSKSAVSGVRQ